MEPPDPFPNSEVKRLSADGSVVRPCESRSSSAPYLNPPHRKMWGVLFGGIIINACQVLKNTLFYPDDIIQESRCYVITQC